MALVSYQFKNLFVTWFVNVMSWFGVFLVSVVHKLLAIWFENTLQFVTLHEKLLYF